MHLALITVPYPGHLRPLSVLARALQARGHRVDLVGVPDTAAAATAAGCGFIPIGEDRFPRGSVARHCQELAHGGPLRSANTFLGFLAAHGQVVLRDAPMRLAAAGVTGVVVDQVEPAGEAVAELVGLPWVVACAAFALHRGVGTPPIWSHAAPARSLLGRAVHALLHRGGDAMVARRHLQPLADFRRVMGLEERPPERLPFATSPLAEVSQEPPVFRDGWPSVPAQVHWCGPFRDASYDDGDLPEIHDDGRPLVFASLGSLQHGRRDLLQRLAGAAADAGIRLVLADGGSLAGVALPGDPLVVRHVRQRALIPHCRGVLSHGGLNTVLDTLAAGVPLGLVPLAFEQPSIATRAAGLGVAAVLRRRPSRPRLAALLRRIVDDPALRHAAQHWAQRCPVDGAATAAGILDQALRSGRPVLAAAAQRHDPRPRPAAHALAQLPEPVGA